MEFDFSHSLSTKLLFLEAGPYAPVCNNASRVFEVLFNSWKKDAMEKETDYKVIERELTQ